MKKIGYVLLSALVLMIGLNSVKAASCYKKTTTSYSSSYVPEVTNKKVNKKKCNGISPCYKHTTQEYTTSCKKGAKVSCKSVAASNCTENEQIYNEDYDFNSRTGLAYVACGKNVSLSKCNEMSGKGAYDIPAMIPRLTAFAVNLLKIVTPVILVFIGGLQLLKAVSSSNEDEIKKAQGKLVKKVIIAVMIFFVIAIVQFVISKVADDEDASVSSCFECFLNNKCPLTYYRGGQSGEKCIDIKDADTISDTDTDEDKSTKTGSTTHQSSSGETHGGDGGSF